MADRALPDPAVAGLDHAAVSGRSHASDSVLARVLAIAAGIAGPNRTPPHAGASTRLWNGGFWLDSLDLIDLMLACDSAFGSVFGASGLAIADTMTVGELAAAIEARTGSHVSKTGSSVTRAR